MDLLNAGMRDSGVYYLQIRGTTYWFLKVYCEQEVAEGGWTVSTWKNILLLLLLLLLCIMCAMFTETKNAFSKLNTCRTYKLELSYTSMPGEGLHFSGERSIVANSAILHVRITKNKNSPR